MTKTHTMKAFDEELDDLRTLVATMATMVEEAFSGAVRALLQPDIELARQVIERDPEIDALKRKLVDHAALVITRRQPMAGDLHEVLADFKIAEDLERIGDLAKNIAKRAAVIATDPQPQDVAADVERLAGLALAQVRLGLDAYMTRNAGQALAVRGQDYPIDALHTALFTQVLQRLAAGQVHVAGLVHLLFCIKNIERVGDHATNIAEAAYLAATGALPADERVTHDDSSTALTTRETGYIVR